MLIGGVGSVLRFVVDRSVAGRVGAHSARHTGGKPQRCSATRRVERLALSHTAALLAGTALIGSYTTFSTWMLETQRLTEERQLWPAARHREVVLGLGAAMAVQWIGGRL